VAGDALGRQGDGSERILDLVSDALGNLFPGKLTLSTEKLGHVFDDEYISGEAMREFKAGACYGETDGAPSPGQFEFSGCSAHSLSAPDDASKLVGRVRRQKSVDTETV
jgi:hypothetical protein